jgi:tetratricopeptide (TPR) repeat protein
MIPDLDLARQHLRADLSNDRSERGRLEVTRLARLALVEANRLDLSAAQHAASQAVASSAPDGDPTCRIRALDGAKLVAAYQGDHAEQRRLITEILARPDPTPGGVYHLHAVAELAMAELSCGNWDRAVDQIDEALGRATKAHVHGLSVALMSGWKIQALIGAGRLGHALDEAEQLMATYTELSAPGIALGVALLARGRARAEAGAFATALADLDGAAELAGSAGFRSLALPAACRAAAVATEVGDVRAARRRRAEALVTAAPLFRFEADSWADLAEAHLAAGETARGAELLAEIEAGMPSTTGSGAGRPPAWVLTRAAMLSSRAAPNRARHRGQAAGSAADPRCQPHAGHRWRAWAARAALTGSAADRAQARAEIEQLAASLSAADQPGFLLAGLSRLSR